MSRKKGQTYTAEQKTKIVLEMLKEEMTTSQIVNIKSLLNHLLNGKFDLMKKMWV